MSAITCPKCHRHVSRPETDDHSVWVRCPLCLAEYSLQSALEFVPPTLVVVPVPVHAGLGAGTASSLEHPADLILDDAFASGIGHPDIANHHPAAEHGGEHLGEHLHDADGLETPFGVEASEHELDEAEHQDGADEFRFADEGAGHGDELGEHAEHAEHGEHDEAHAGQALGSLATMVAAQPTKKKRKVPFKVKLVGITVFLVIFLIIDVIGYCGLLFMGMDPFNLKDKLPFPKFIVAKSLREAPPTQPSKKPSGSISADRPTGPGSMPNAAPPQQPDTATSTPEKPTEGPAKPATDTPGTTAVAPNPADVATTPKPGPDANPFTDPTKTGPADPAQVDLTKIAPPALEVKPPKATGPMPPSVDSPNPADKGVEKTVTKPAEKPIDPFDKPADKTPEKPADKPADKTPEKPADKTPEKPAEKPSDKPIEKPIEKPADAPAAKAAVGPKAEAAFSLGDAGAAVDAAQKATTAYADAAGKPDATDDLKKARIAEFKALSHAATVLSSTKAEGADAARFDAIKAQAAALLAGAANGSGAEREEIGKLSDRWMTSPSRKENGAFVGGTLKKSVQVGKLYQSEVQLFGKPTVVTVLSLEKPAAAEGSPVSVLGAIVDEPSKNIAGYEGDAPTAVWGAVIAAAGK